MKLTSADIKFLNRIAAGEIKEVAGYTRKRGGYRKFYGGEKNFKRFRQMGLANIGTPSLGLPAIAFLTDAGREAICQAIVEEKEPR